MSRLDRTHRRGTATAPIPARVTTRWVGGLALIGLLALFASPVAADSPATPVVAEPTPRVEGAFGAGNTARTEGSGSGQRPTTGAATQPLTRAIVRARIAAIDPEHWLSRYGKTAHRESTQD